MNGGGDRDGGALRRRAWRSAMDLAVEVFRATRPAPGAREDAFVGRMRLAALRIPALVTRAIRRSSGRRAADLEAARALLEELEGSLRLTAARLPAPPGHARRLRRRADACRVALEELARRSAPESPHGLLERPGACNVKPRRGPAGEV